MQLKTYQQTALMQLDAYLDALKTAVQDRQAAADFYAGRNAPVPDGLQNAPANAWNTLKQQGHLPAIADNGKVVIPDYIARTASCGEPIAKVVQAKHKTAVVFATHKFIGQKQLTLMNIIFAQIPYSLNGGISR